MLKTTPTYVARITNHSQVRGDLDECGFSTSKLWNVGRYYIQGRWDKDGEIPDEGELKSELKDHERYSDALFCRLVTTVSNALTVIFRQINAEVDAVWRYGIAQTAGVDVSRPCQTAR